MNGISWGQSVLAAHSKGSCDVKTCLEGVLRAFSETLPGEMLSLSCLRVEITSHERRECAAFALNVAREARVCMPMTRGLASGGLAQLG